MIMAMKREGEGSNMDGNADKEGKGEGGKRDGDGN